MTGQCHKRQRSDGPTNENDGMFHKYEADSMTNPVGPPELKPDNWQGWAEIESDPAFFNVILDELGVKGVSIREIFSLDGEMLALLPRPVYGIIFLFRWREDDTFTDARFKAGNKVWFANQTVSNACASFALLNIVMNISGLDLGPQLSHFRDFTKDFTPALRGDALANFEFAKAIHNSFSRRMDQLGADIFMKSQYQPAKHQSKKRKQEDRDDNEDDAAHHFIAFMPINGVIWKMDGLEWQPRSLGKIRCEDWLDQIKADLEARMSRCADGEMDFALLALVKDPMVAQVERLAINVKSLRELKFSSDQPDVLAALSKLHIQPLFTPDSSYNLFQTDLDLASIHKWIDPLMSNGRHVDAKTLVATLLEEQTELLRSIKNEQQTKSNNAARAGRRRHDCGEAIRHWLSLLSRRGAIKCIVTDSR